MGRNKISVLVFVIIGLALIGLFSQLFTNTADFFGSMFMMLGISIAIFAAIYFIFLKKRAPSNEMKKYKQAVKQSKQKYKKHDNSSRSSISRDNLQSSSVRNGAKKRASHLRVIEGNKSKRKKRASN